MKNRSLPPMWKEEQDRRRMEIARLTLAGKSVNEICREVGVSRSTVGRIRGELGLTTDKKPPLSDDEIRLAEQLLDDGASISEVARTLERGISTIWRKFPGRAWTDDERVDYCRTLRMRPEDQSRRAIESAWRVACAHAATPPAARDLVGVVAESPGVAS